MIQRRKRPAASPPSAVPGAAARGGFTLIELLAVITIIGIILSLVLVAGMDAANRANERATQSLITKLEQGLNDRLEALLQYQPEPNYTHGYLAAIYGSINGINYQIPPLTLTLYGNPVPNPAVTETQRAQVIALYDYIKAEMPDVFFVQSTAPGTSGYPFNFAAVPILGTGQVNYILPLGNSAPGPQPNGYGDFNTSNPNLPQGPVSNPTLGYAGSGIYGAAYEVAAGLYKGLGYLPTGYDGVDNDQDTYIDNWNEGVNSANSAQVTTNLQNHTHVTARSEMLYALLVSGTGPLGSVYSPDDFTSREVQDTDNDGMPEFVDAWGQPLQFFRWPVLYHSDLQRGQTIVPDPTTAVQQWDLVLPYYDPINSANGVLQEREQDPLDVNQQLVAPGWWANQGSGGIAANSAFPFSTFFPSLTVYAPSNASGGAQAFQALFHTLYEPCPTPVAANSWDRGGGIYAARRAYYSKFLILSGGPDQAPGVFLYSDAVLNAAGTGASQMLIANENNALPFSLDVADFTKGYTLSNTFFPPTGTTYPSSNDPTNPNSYDLQQNAQDDITNHNLLAGGAIGGSG